MENSKLLGLLQTFESTEWRAFRDLVASPYFNKQAPVLALCDYLKKAAAQGFPARKMQRATIYKALFPNESYDDKQWNYIISALLKLAEKFVGLTALEQDGILMDCYTLRAYLDRKQEKGYRYIYEHAAEKLAARPYRDATFHYQSFLLADIAEQHFNTQNSRRFDAYLQEASDALDSFYLARKLAYLCAMLDRQKIIPEPYQFHLLPELESHLLETDYVAVPAVNLYKQLLQLLQLKEPLHNFQRFKALLATHAANFPAQETKDLYYFAINFCIHQIRLGEQSYAEELVDLYEKGLSGGYLLDDGRLSPWTFKNMVKLGLGLGRFDWVEQFLADYSSRLPETHRADAYHFNMADLHYHKRQFGPAMDHLFQVAYSDIHYSIGSKTMLLKIYYEKKETEAFYALFASFKAFLKRNKLVSKEVKEPYFNFAQLLFKLQKYGREMAGQLETEIAETPMLADRSWLLQQAKALGKLKG